MADRQSLSAQYGTVGTPSVASFCPQIYHFCTKVKRSSSKTFRPALLPNAAYNGNRQSLLRFQPDAIRANTRIVEALNAFGCTRGITPAQTALAWLMNKKPFIVPIPGTTKLSHLEENLRACDITFTANEMKELEDAVSAIPVIGSRYDALQESKVQK